MDKAAKPLKIFISYGHEIDVKDENGKKMYPEPNNESVVRRIKAYLESRGHTVWLDTDQIKEGKDWRRKIYEGIEDSNVVIVCLSRKAMKPNGVCRDEIAIAIGVCGKNLFPVKLEDSNYPSYLTNYQFINDFQEWSSHISADTIDEAWLDKNLEKLAKLLEKENVRLYYDEIVELKNFLRPWNMNSRLKKLDTDIHYHYNKETKETEKTIVHEFCGRESLFKMFEEQLVQGGEAVRKESQRVLWLRKGPGFGKSRFAAELHYRYCYAIRAAYFIEYNQRESFKPQTFVKSVAYQLAQANNSYRKKLLSYLKENQDNINLQTGDPQTLFRTLVVDLMVDEIDGDNGTQWILVDALDEATDNGRNEIASLISQNLDNLPSWLCFFITSRDNDSAVNRNFSQFTPINFSDEENKIDVREYILKEINERRITVQGDPEELVNILHEKSEGTFLYPEMVFRDLTEDSISLEDIRSLPSGVLGYIHKRFDYLYGNNIELYASDVRPALGYIFTSCEPISRAVLKHCLRIDCDSEFNKRLKALGTFFIQSGLTDKDTIVPFHKSIKDYCFDIESSTVDYCIYPEEANKNFANRGLELYKSGVLQWTTRSDEEPNIVQRYFLTWLPSHLMNANMKEEAAAVLSDFAFLMKRLRYGNVERVILDYLHFRGKLNRISPESDAYFNVVCSNAHFLRRNSEGNPAHKIMLQIATEVADECPVTQAAERWLNPKTGDSPCNWFWLNKANRPKEYYPNPCKLVIENVGDWASLLSNEDVLSWGTNDSNLRIWDLKLGVCRTILKGHTKPIKWAIELSSGNILSWSEDNTLRLWFSDGTCKVLEGHTGHINGAIELRSGDILSWSDDKTLRLWSPDGVSKLVMEGDIYVYRALELSSGSILTWGTFQEVGKSSVFDLSILPHLLNLWSPDGRCKEILEELVYSVANAEELSSGNILILFWRMYNEGPILWILSPEGACKEVLKEHTDINDTLELSSGDILSWSSDSTMHLWSPEGKLKEVLEGHTGSIMGAIELSSGDILSWCYDQTLRLWSPEGKCKGVLEGHTNSVVEAIELRSGDILSWSDDFTLRIWSLEGTCKAVLEGHANRINYAKELTTGDILSWSGADDALCIWSPDFSRKIEQTIHMGKVINVIKLSSGNILSWSEDCTLCLWSPNGICKAVLDGHTDAVSDAIELHNGDILSWCNHFISKDHTLRLWSPDGKYKAVLDGRTDTVSGAIELHNGDILSWCNHYIIKDHALRLWSPDGEFKKVLNGCSVIELRSGDILTWSERSLRLWTPDGTRKAVLKGHTNSVIGAIELSSSEILSWSDDHTLRLWSPNGKFKKVLEGHADNVEGAIELHSGDIISWSKDNIMRLWTPDGNCKAVLEGHTRSIERVIELRSGDILSQSDDKTLHLWSPEGTYNEVIDPNNPQYDSFYSFFISDQVFEQFYAKGTSWGIELQYDFKSIARWNSPSCHSCFVSAGRLCVWYGKCLEVLQLNYGNHMSVSFDQAHQFLAGEIDEFQLVTYVPEQKDAVIPKTE